MKKNMSGIFVARIFGIPITLDYSWFLIFGLLSWSLANGYFRQAVIGFNPQMYWLMGIGASLLLFLSILLHELAHAIVAKSKGIPIRGITLHVFGGVAEMQEEVKDAKSELQMAAAGPLTSIFLGLLFGLFYYFSSSPFYKPMFFYLFNINVILAIFNLIPGFPLDGGRIFRAILWIKNKDYFKSTKWATRMGTVIAYLFMLFGFMEMLNGTIFSGVWLVFIGFFLRHATDSSYRLLTLKRGLTGMTAESLMIRDVNTVTPDMTLQRFVDDYILIFRHHSFPVVQNGQALGIITFHDLKDTPRGEWDQKTVQDVMTPMGPDYMICARCELSDAFIRAAGNGIGRLVVVNEHDQFVGYLSFRDLETLLTLKTNYANSSSQ